MAIIVGVPAGCVVLIGAGRRVVGQQPLAMWSLALRWEGVISLCGFWPIGNPVIIRSAST